MKDNIAEYSQSIADAIKPASREEFTEEMAQGYVQAVQDVAAEYSPTTSTTKVAPDFLYEAIERLSEDHPVGLPENPEEGSGDYIPITVREGSIDFTADRARDSGAASGSDLTGASAGASTAFGAAGANAFYNEPALSLGLAAGMFPAMAVGGKAGGRVGAAIGEYSGRKDAKNDLNQFESDLKETAEAVLEERKVGTKPSKK